MVSVLPESSRPCFRPFAGALVETYGRAVVIAVEELGVERAGYRIAFETSIGVTDEAEHGTGLERSPRSCHIC